jgi:hypothetical protein
MDQEREDARGFVDHVVAALDNAPPYVIEILAKLAEINKRRAEQGLPMIDAEGRISVRPETLAQFLQRPE